MNYLKYIRLINFQGHKDSYIEFDKGTNVILGHTDVGKSSIIRAIYWVAFNKPSGKEYPSHWGGDMLVEIGQENGMVVSKGRDKKGQFYRISTYESDFRAFGAGEPPEEVKKALNLIPINIQKQMDPPFLLSKNPGQVATELNTVMDLDIIDHSISQAKKLKTKANGDLRIEKEMLLKLEEELKEYHYLDEMKVMVGKLEEDKAKKDKLEKDNIQLRKTIDQICLHKTKIEKTKNIIKFEKNIDSILVLMKTNKIIEKSQKHLKTLIQNIKNKTETISKNRKIVLFQDTIEKILEETKKYSSMIKHTNSLGNMLHRIKTTKKKIQNEKQNHQILQKELREEFPEECPLCGNNNSGGSQ